MRHYRGDYPAQLWLVLNLAHERYISVSGDWARSLASEVALAASLGWLSNIAPDGQTYSNKWRITPAGLTALMDILPQLVKDAST
jgi:hypothetical protein